MNEKNLMLLGTLGAVVGILPIVAWFIGGNKLEGNNKETLKTMANLEIIILVAAIVLSLIPVVGMFVSLGVLVINVLVAIKSYTAIDKEAFKLPVIEILK